MPTSPPPLVYFDSCVMLEYINAEDASNLSNIDGILQDTNIQIVTSLISIVEVAKGKVEQDSKVLSPAVEAQINKLWEVESPIEVVEFYELIADGARALIRQATSDGFGLQAADAIHLATAMRLNVQRFYTYDQKLFKFHSMCRFPIGPPEALQPTLTNL